MKKTLILAVILIFTCSVLCFAKTVRKHYPNGKLKSVIHYNKKGQTVGHYKLYWPNGKVKEEGTFKKGKLVTPVYRYTVDGTPLDQ